MRIGLLQAGHLPEEIQAELGDYPDLYRRLLNNQGLELVPYPVVDGVFPDDPGEAEGWLISGSRHGAYEALDWIPPLEDFVRAIRARGLPLVGICFGHQIIAQALGGKVEKFSGGWSVGHHRYDWRGTPVVLNAWHQDQVTELPEGAEVIAGSPFCRNAALVYGDRIFTIQPHPEFDRRTTEMLIEGRGRGVVPDKILDAAAEKLDHPTDDMRLAEEIGAFFRKARTA